MRHASGAAASTSDNAGSGPTVASASAAAFSAMRRLPAEGGSGKPSGTRPASASSGDARRTISGQPRSAHARTSGSAASAASRANAAPHPAAVSVTSVWRRSGSSACGTRECLDAPGDIGGNRPAA